MAIKGYLVYNISQEKQAIFKSQIKAWQNAFKLEGVDLKLTNNFKALSILKKSKPNFVLFWDKDVALMYEIMNLGIKVFNSVDAVRLCDDKAFTYAYLIKRSVLTPKTVVSPLTFYVPIEKYFNEIKVLMKENKIGYPCIVKERRSSLGLGVYLVKNDVELKKVFKTFGYRELIIQEYIAYQKGTDYRVYLINHKPVIAVTRVNKKDFRSNVEQGGVMSLIKKPEPTLLSEAIKASKALKLDFGAVDLVKAKDHRYYVLEVNSNARTATIDKISKTPLTRSVAKYILNNL